MPLVSHWECAHQLYVAASVNMQGERDNFLVATMKNMRILRSSPPVTGVAYLGQEQSFTYLAARSFFRDMESRVVYAATRSVKDTCGQIKDGVVDYGVVALESSSHGSIHEVYDSLLNLEGVVTIVGEVAQLEEHCLCATSDVDGYIINLTDVYGHPHMLECCSDYLDALDAQRKARGLSNINRLAASDSIDACTALRAAAREVGKKAAAIASKEAAGAHSLNILVQGIGNDANAETRYVILARRNATNGALCDPLHIAPEPLQLVDHSPRRALKVSIALGLRNVPGALFKMTSCFAFRDMNIVKIESRPTAVAAQQSLTSLLASRRHWDLIYYLDYEPGDNAAANMALLNSLGEFCLWVRELGFYYSGLQPVDSKPTEWKQILDVIGH